MFCWKIELDRSGVFFLFFLLVFFLFICFSLLLLGVVRRELFVVIIDGCWGWMKDLCFLYLCNVSDVYCVMSSVRKGIGVFVI